MRNVRILVGSLLAVGLIGTLISGAEVYVRLLYLMGGMVVIAWGWSWLSLKNIKVQRDARILRGQMGDIFEEVFEISNTGWLPRLWIEVLNQSSLPGASGSRLITGLRGKQKRVYLARTWLTRRGAFPLGPTRLTSGDPLGLFQSNVNISPARTLVVLPHVVEISTFPSPLGVLPGGKTTRKKALDSTPHAAGVREYVAGDALKRIHWASTARRGKMMVKEFEQDPQAEVWLFLDAQAGGVHAEMPFDDQPDQEYVFLLGRKRKLQLPPSTLEYAVSVAASLAHYFLKQRRAVGFVVSAQRFDVIAAERSERQENKILEKLAFIKPEGRLPFAGLIETQARALPLGSTAILITPVSSQKLVLAVQYLLQRKIKPVVILVDAVSFGAPSSENDWKQALVSLNIPVWTIYNGDDLAKTLEDFAAEHLYQERFL